MNFLNHKKVYYFSVLPHISVQITVWIQRNIFNKPFLITLLITKTSLLQNNQLNTENRQYIIYFICYKFNKSWYFSRDILSFNLYYCQSRISSKIGLKISLDFSNFSHGKLKKQWRLIALIFDHLFFLFSTANLSLRFLTPGKLRENEVLKFPKSGKISERKNIENKMNFKINFLNLQSTVFYLNRLITGTNAKAACRRV